MPKILQQSRQKQKQKNQKMATIPSFVPQGLDNQKDVLANHLSVLTSIRAYCIGVEQTSIQNIINPTPEWFTTLNTNLGLAKTHATVWTSTLEPAITTTIPQAAIAFGTKFGVASQSILNILNTSDYTPNQAQINQISQALAWMSKDLVTQQTEIDAQQATFKKFQSDSDTDLTNLTTGNNSIQQAILDDQKVVTSLTGDIAVQNANIAADNAAITASAIAGGIGLFVGVGMLGLGAAATGPAAPIVMAIGGLIMVGSIVEMAATIAVYSAKLAEAQNKLAQDTADLNAENTQIASLTIMNNSISSLVDMNKAMAQSLTDIANWWAIISKDIHQVSSDIQSSIDDMTKEDWYGLSLDLAQAQGDWKTFVEFATNMQIAATTIQNQVVVVPPSTQAA
jgi:Bacillus haemolytic enterotoxin (HBL)